MYQSMYKQDHIIYIVPINVQTLGRGGGQIVRVLSPYNQTIQVRIPLMPSVFSVKFVLEKDENKQKEAGLAH